VEYERAPQETKARNFFLRLWWLRKAAQEMDLDSIIQFQTYERAHTRKGVHSKPKKGRDPCFQTG
jgi:hypothetical protein